MKRAIFLVAGLIACFGVASAQAQYAGSYYYGAQQPYQAYGYSGYQGGSAPSYYYGGNQYYGGQPYTRGSDYTQDRDAYQQSYYSGMDGFKREHTKKDYGKNPPVEIWLGRQIGRVGDYWFPALGGGSKHPTPTGSYTVKAKHEDFYSNKYKAEMPLSVFFTEQCALHIGSLRVKSHGCIHLAAEDAQKIFAYADVGDTKVVVHP